jgi:predicted pyridoxine 5'-phosphate oxidase superfamily flavin-nucleotide-binding protein
LLHKYLQIASTPAVRIARDRYGSAAHYARVDGSVDDQGAVSNGSLGPREASFIAARDGFFIASVSETGWPYVQFRGGLPGFLHVLDDSTLGYADLRGNRQYLTVGNVAANDRVSLLLMDYANQQRLKMFGRVRVTHATDDPALAARLAVPGYPGRVERAVLTFVEGFDWNCAQHITPRFTEAEFTIHIQRPGLPDRSQRK